MFSAKISDQLGSFLIGDRIAEGRHLLAAGEDLVGDPGRGPELVLAQVNERRRFLGADAADAVTVGATFVAKQDRAGPFGGLGASFGLEEAVGRERGEKDDGGQKGEALQTRNHRSHFRIPEGRGASIFRRCRWEYSD